MRRDATWIWQHADWPAFRWDPSRLASPLARARLAQGRVLGKLDALGLEVAADALADITVAEALGTAAIEGERLDPAAVRSSVARHLGLDAAGLPAPSRPVDGLVEVLLDATRGHDRPLTLERLCTWQAALFPTGRSGLSEIRVGALRGDAPMRVVSGRFGRERVHFEAPPRERLEAELERFLGWFDAPPEGLDGLVRAGLAHLWLVTLHPFEDGNGRIARAVTDMALCQDEGSPVRAFSLSARIVEVREDYYRVLEETQRGGMEVTAWLGWFLEQVEAAARESEAVVARIVAKARFWVRHRDTPLNARQRKVLNRLLDAGPGGFEGGMTTRKYAHLTGTSRATAQRELADLVAKGCLRPLGRGRATAYEPVLPE